MNVLGLISLINKLTVGSVTASLVLVMGTAKSDLDINYQVQRVIDGDTIKVFNIDTKEQLVLRLCGIDAPELARSRAESVNPKNYDAQLKWGLLAKAHLDHMIKPNDTIQADITSTDRFGRKIANISINEVDLSLELVRLGFAQVYYPNGYYKDCTNASQLVDAEKEAKINLLNTWGQSGYILPWKYRQLRNQ